MEIIEYAILGLIQGISEFLPISSSGHLIVARNFFGLSIENSLAFDVFLNSATLLSVIICFWGDLKRVAKDFISQGPSSRSKTLIYAIILGSIPAGLIGFIYGDKIDELFRSESVVALALIFGSLVMFIADRINAKGGITALKGFVVGFFQALALIPGMSRSGMTISGGIFTGLSREEAVRFSFLLLIPVSIGALFKILLDLNESNLTQFINISYIAAFIGALLSGLWSLRFLVRYISKNSFTPFIIYRILLAAIIFLFI